MIPPLLALFAWPLISIAFFRKLSLPLASLVTIIGGFLLLPENTALDLPGMPSLDKTSIPALTALVLVFVFSVRADQVGSPKGLVPQNSVILMLLVALVGGAILTALTNSDSLTYGSNVLPRLRIYDAGSMAISAFFLVLPLLLARRFFASPEAHRLILVVFFVAAFGYSFLALFEVRMSPQLNRWIYGFFPHGWIQHVRGGAFRPVVFLQHGLVLGIFLCMAILATVVLGRLDARRRGWFLLGLLWLLITIFLSRNLGALFITGMLLPVVFFLGVRGQLLVAAIIAGMFLAYPVVRSSEILPIDRIVQLAEDIDPQRAGSFLTRLENEDRMLAKAAERPLFGWGGWGRSRVYNDAGADITIADGAWIITLGVSGWVGYIARYGLLTLPIFLLFFHRRHRKIGMESSALAVILAANLIDLVPNSSNLPLTWLLAGALWGRLEWQGSARPQAVAKPATQRAGYTRPSKVLPAPPDPEPSALSLPQTPYTRQKTRIVRKKTLLKPSHK